MKALYKTTIVIWTEEDPGDMEIVDLAQSATDGLGYCSKQETFHIKDPSTDLEWDGTTFFEEECDDN